ncbi:MAG: response regulator [Deltaproteobacteria bacterium]|nr:response regulator [Deltaproteobacteria bacterium]
MEVSILFVDDEPQVLRALARSLKGEQYTLAFSGDPLDALARLTERPFDIVVSDYMMPNMTGVELLTRVHECRPATLRMMMTGHADKQATIMAINEGAICHYLEKPWSDAELKSVLRDAAQSVAVQRAARAAAPDLAAAARRFGRMQFRGSA